MFYNKFLLLCTILCWAILVVRAQNTCSAVAHEAEEFFERENELLRQRMNLEYIAAYNYNTNVTEETRLEMIRIATANADANKKLAHRIKQSCFNELTDEKIKRQIFILSELGADVLSESDFKDLQNAISSMETNYATSTVCSYHNSSDCSLTLEPHVQERLSNSRDHKELEHYWREWHDKAGTPMRNHFAKYVELKEKAAKLNNYYSNAEYWIHFYEDPNFEKNLDDVYNKILPLYKEIHGYVRYRLREYYGEKIVPEWGNIPLHLLGNMWAQQWDEAIDLFTPFPQRPFVDVTSELQQQGYTVKKMFELGDQFFQSLNMIPLPASFWNLSVLERPNDREIVCHASAWDFYQDSDVRIKMCTELNTHYLYVVHHELGHIQYYLQYENQPTAFRGAPNPGFHEAVGDVIALSVSSPKHLKRIGLSNIGKLDEESRINELFKTALKKIVFLPFAYTMDKYRYTVFRKEVPESAWNCEFWRMRSELTGVEPPVKRTDQDFDPPAKYHIDADVEYLRYFAAHIFQFQFHKAMCIQAGEYVPGDANLVLDNCDIYNSKKAGKAFSKFLSVGTSIHWKDVLEEFTGDRAMDPAALLEYFEPLHKWIKEENRRLNVPIGWGPSSNFPSKC